MDAKMRAALLLKPRYMYKTCGHCGTRQLKAKCCRACGQPINKEDQTSDYRNDAELEAAVYAAAHDGISKEARKSGLICSSCSTAIAANEAFCPACGHPADESDKAVSVQKRNAKGEMVEVENDGARFPGAAKAVAALTALLPTPSPDSSSSTRSGETLDQKIIGFATSPVGIGIGVFVVLFILWALFWPFTASATLINTQYKPQVEISYIEVKHDYCWLGIDCPSGYVELSRSQQDYTPPGEVVVSTRTVNESDYGEVQVDTITVTQIVESVSYGEPGPEYNCSENDETIDDVFYPGVCTPVPQPTYEYDSEDVSQAVYSRCWMTIWSY